MLPPNPTPRFGEALSQNIVGSNDHCDWLKLSARVAIVWNQKTLWRLTTVVRKPQTSQDACNNESAKRNNMKSVGAGQLWFTIWFCIHVLAVTVLIFRFCMIFVSVWSTRGIHWCHHVCVALRVLSSIGLYYVHVTLYLCTTTRIVFGFPVYIDPMFVYGGWMLRAET